MGQETILRAINLKGFFLKTNVQMCLLSVFNITANITEIRIKTQIIK